MAMTLKNVCDFFSEEKNKMNLFHYAEMIRGICAKAGVPFDEVMFIHYYNPEKYPKINYTLIKEVLDEYYLIYFEEEYEKRLSSINKPFDPDEYVKQFPVVGDIIEYVFRSVEYSGFLDAQQSLILKAAMKHYLQVKYDVLQDEFTDKMFEIAYAGKEEFGISVVEIVYKTLLPLYENYKKIKVAHLI